MKLIMENWRSWMGGGAKMHPKIKEILEAIVEQTNVSVAIKEKVESVEVTYVDADTLEPSGLPEGIIQMELDPSYNGPCLHGYVVSWAKASPGWGPLLYEVAMEWASKNATGLTSDRYSVSDDAQGVWRKYAQRPDVDPKQLDVDLKTMEEVPDWVQPLTPDDPTDDCVQLSNFKTLTAADDWEESPLAKVYSKSTQEVTKALKKAGRLVIM